MATSRGLAFIVLLEFFLHGQAEVSGKLLSCELARFQCQNRDGCQMALKNFFIHCQLLIKGRPTQSCPTDCKHAIVSLLSTEDRAGFAFINCDCQKEKSCAARKKRVEVCQREVLESMYELQKDSAPVTCNLARSICEADTSCLAALDYYYAHCSRLFSGVRCTSKCRNSLEVLSRQAHASKLRSCLCDGKEDYDCQKLKVNTQTLCLHSKRRRRQKHRNTSTEVTSTEVTATTEENSPRKSTRGGVKLSRRRKRRNRQMMWQKDIRNTRRELRKITQRKGETGQR